MNHAHDSIHPVVAFVGVEPSLPLRDYAATKVGALLGADVYGCRVVLESHHHSHAGPRFRAKVEIDLPHKKLVVGSTDSFGDLYAAIDAATSDAKSVLHEVARRSRAIVRRRADASKRFA